VHGFAPALWRRSRCRACCWPCPQKPCTQPKVVAPDSHSSSPTTTAVGDSKNGGERDPRRGLEGRGQARRHLLASRRAGLQPPIGRRSGQTEWTAEFSAPKMCWSQASSSIQRVLEFGMLEEPPFRVGREAVPDRHAQSATPAIWPQTHIEVRPPLQQWGAARMGEKRAKEGAGGQRAGPTPLVGQQACGLAGAKSAVLTQQAPPCRRCPPYRTWTAQLGQSCAWMK
jgi:hypothetical protein